MCPRKEHKKSKVVNIEYSYTIYGFYKTYMKEFRKFGRWRGRIPLSPCLIPIQESQIVFSGKWV